ncbi:MULTISPECIES: ABC transporter permease [Gracilibacillus]|uniref:ABC transporter permease n=1 Tax=Gracilibacillus TaxID=74385 RepID=UPI00082402D7|nr:MULTISPECIES: ABC transporter permease [Gracilibacillus]
MAVKQWKALIYKDMCDLRWNGQILFNMMSSIAFVTVFSFIPGQQLQLSFLIAFILLMLTMYMQGNMVVEEYEQKTRRRLSQANVSFKIMFLAKMAITFMITSIVLIAFFFFHSDRLLACISIYLLTLPLIILIQLVGLMLGIKTKNTIELSMYGMPIMLLYFFVEGLLMNSNQPDEWKWLAVLPNYHLHHGIEQIQLQQPFMSSLIVPLIWMAAAILLFVWWFRKQRHRLIS